MMFFRQKIGTTCPVTLALTLDSFSTFSALRNFFSELLPTRTQLICTVNVLTLTSKHISNCTNFIEGHRACYATKNRLSEAHPFPAAFVSACPISDRMLDGGMQLAVLASPYLLPSFEPANLLFHNICMIGPVIGNCERAGLYTPQHVWHVHGSKCACRHM